MAAVFKAVVKPRSVLLESYYSEINDTQRGQVVRLSRQHGCWYLVNFSGSTWETYAHIPAQFKQCVSFVDGKFCHVYMCEQQ